MNTTLPFEQASQSDQNERDRDDWIAVVAVRYPEATVRHPSILDLVKEELGRFCLVDNRHEGVRVSFGVSGDTIVDARRESAEVTEHLLSMLGLSNTDVVEYRLSRPLNPRAGEWAPKLRLVEP